MTRAARILETAVSLLLALRGGFTPLPRRSSLETRLAAFPTRGLPLDAPVAIHWNEHQIPFIEAATDADLAFALGLVHAHLRLGQMEILRRLSQGRVAEMAGPLAADLDHLLRILDFGRAAAATEAALPAETRTWVERFVAGVNHHQAAARRLPHEYAALGLAREPWTVRDLLTIGRLAGTDINWLVWFRLLPLRARADWPRLWARLVSAGTESLAGLERGGELAALAEILRGAGRPGSNAVAVAGTRSATGAALMASDPHLGLMLPNLWLIAGIKSPSYHAAGLMVPGLPVIAIGRNPRIAWSGTNLRAASSDLFDVSKLAGDSVSARTETLRRRGWPARRLKIRESPFGPILSDAPALRRLGLPDMALRWVGHEPSDEITAMLKVSRARSWKEFREAFATFAVPAQTMLYADADGNIGRVLAARLPARARPLPPDLILDPGADAWREFRDARTLPAEFNPARGFLVSANDRPPPADVPVGYFFSPADRARRMAELLEAEEKIAPAHLERLQRDVRLEAALAVRDAVVARLAATGVAAHGRVGARRVLEILAGWDGDYRADSRGALAFELFLGAFTAALRGRHREGVARDDSRPLTLVMENLRRTPPEALVEDLRAALADAARGLARFADWGDVHRLRLAHPLARLPLLGRRYRLADGPAAGTTDTVMKTAHAPVTGRHAALYGSNARFVADLSDPDDARFVLLGGQDGWFGSSTFLDQLPLWQTGGYVRVPLRPETVRATFGHKTVLSPR